MAVHFTYQSYAWSLGTTSFRMADFHRNVERQLLIIDEFWHLPENQNKRWESNSNLQKRYYDFAFQKGFITGDIQNDDVKKAKTARQKTSGLVDIGLINDARQLTEVGYKLLNMTQANIFISDNEFQIPSDSFLYFKQLIKTSYSFQSGYARPFLIIGMLLQNCERYLTDDEFTYLLPLCVSDEITRYIIQNIKLLRSGLRKLDDIIIDTVLSRYNYPLALTYLIKSKKLPEDIMIIGMNRDGIKHDAVYAELYAALLAYYRKHTKKSIKILLDTVKKIKNKPGTFWRNLLFKNSRTVKSEEDLNSTNFDTVRSEKKFAHCFFTYLHLIKIKATLSDYKDLNRRYLMITDAFIFNDGKVSFTPLFEYYFKTDAKNVFHDAFKECSFLAEDCSLEKINPSFRFDCQQILKVFNSEKHTQLKNIEELYKHIESDRYDRFRRLIDSNFPNNVLISVLDRCEKRNSDKELINLFGGEADVPTIFEYIVAIAWYRISQYHGSMLDYMNMSLDANLLPRTHAGGGQADIVYRYEKTSDYPAYSLLIECALMEGTVQRHGEMEPVSRHLANYLIKKDNNAYCIFISTELHASVISDFRMRKDYPFYINEFDHVDGMKIIPLHTKELKTILEKKINYSQIYNVLEEAYKDKNINAPPRWYVSSVRFGIEAIIADNELKKRR